MSNRLGGRQGTAYVGTNANQPPNMVYNNRPPTQYDINYSVGDFWIDESAADVDKLWVLVSLVGNSTTKGALGHWIQLGTGSASNVNTLTGNSGGAVGPDGANNINVVGDGTTADVVGNPGTNTLTISATGAVPIQFDEDVGSAVPVLGVLNVLGGSNMNTSGAGNTVTINLNDWITWPATNLAGTSGLIVIDGDNFLYSPRGTNTFTGQQSGNLSLTGDFNNGYGLLALGSVTTGDNNNALGTSALGGLTTGSDNIAIGDNAGTAYTTEGSNITIGNTGTVADGNTIRIGTEGNGAGQQDTTFIAGIYNTTGLVGTRAVVVDANGQLGTGDTDIIADVQTVDATPTTLYSIALAEDEAIVVNAYIVAAQTDYSAAIIGRLNGGARRMLAGATTIVGSPISDYSEDFAGAPTYTISTSGNNVIIQVTGLAATTINWRGNIKYTILDL